MNVNFFATGHAIDRWRERAAEYASATAADLISAVKESRKIEVDEPIPFRKESSCHYYFHEKTGAYFIVLPENVKDRKIISVIVPGQKSNWINSKSRVKLDEIIEEPQPLLTPEPVNFKNNDEEYNWCKNEYSRLCKAKSKTNKDDPNFPAIDLRVKELQARIIRLKALCSGLPPVDENVEIFTETVKKVRFEFDSTINNLVKTQKTEIDQLKTRTFYLTMALVATLVLTLIFILMR